MQRNHTFGRTLLTASAIILAVWAAVMLFTATAGWANGDLPPAVCVGQEGVVGATQGRYGADTPWVQTGSPVPLTHDGKALTGVGGPGWNRPLGQVPACVPSTTTSTTSASTSTTTTQPDVTTTSKPSTTVTAPETTSTTKPKAARISATTTSYDVGTHAPSYGPGEPQPTENLPRTGGSALSWALVAFVLLAIGSVALWVSRTFREKEPTNG